ncbi:MAG: hypothetical protein L0H51_07090, partial [Psychrobacter sp.]|nr:hypothetical protein [Psychrobacter sp.]
YQNILLKITFYTKYLFKYGIDANDTSYAVGGIITKPKRIASIVCCFPQAFCINLNLPQLSTV